MGTLGLGPSGRCMLSLRGLRATSVSSCQPSPGQELAAERAPGFGSRSLGGPAEPAGLLGEPVPRAEAGASARTEGAWQIPKPAHPLCQGSTLPSGGTPLLPATAGSSEGLPSVEDAGAFWAERSLSGSSKAPQPLCQLPSFLPKEDFWESGGCSEPTGQSRCLWRGTNKLWASMHTSCPVPRLPEPMQDALLNRSKHPPLWTHVPCASHPVQAGIGGCLLSGPPPAPMHCATQRGAEPSRGRGARIFRSFPFER